MMKRTWIVAAATATILVAGVEGPAPTYAATPGTTTNGLTAMHDEALAYAEYSAWSDHASSTGNLALAGLLMATASQERGEHFRELSDAFGLVGGNAQNIRTAILDEGIEATTLYPGFARRAAADGDTVAAALFTELARDEADHKAILVCAHRALVHGGRYPDPLVVTSVPIVEGPALSSGVTLANVGTALLGEAFASARYQLFGHVALATGKPKLAAIFYALSDYELVDHFAVLANQYGLVGSDVANLAAASTAEDEAIVSYTAFAAEATAAGDTGAAALFTDLRGDEVLHRAAFGALSGG